ncbi:MAG: hypothetical protein K5886_00250 [Lachnospiraceae bacterium]|nr:hypothetical protein [Lachnospiraceae bacterium]
MRKYLLKLCIYILILFTIFASVNVFIDPYNIFHYSAPKNNGVESNKNYIKTRYILDNPDKFDSFVFGSSRAGFVNTYDIPDGKYYNMCSSEAVPHEHLRILKVFIKNGIVPKNVLILLDDISCFVDPALHDQMLYRVPYPDDDPVSKMKFYYRYCDLITTMEALRVMRAYVDDDPEYLNRYLNSGSERMDRKASEIAGDFSEGYWADYYSLRIDEVISDIEEIIKLCADNGINLIFVTNPMYYKTYTLGVEQGYLEFLDALSKVTDFWNFSSYSDITVDTANYYETSHFTPDTGRMMIDTVFRGAYDERLYSQGFGVHVDSDNREEFISMIKRQAGEFGVERYEQ